MCTGAEIAALAAATVLSAGGTVMSASAAEAAANKRQRIINQANEQEAENQDRRQQVAEQFVQDTLTPQNRRATLEQAATDANTSLVDALQSAQQGNAAEVKTGAEGRLSGDYTRAAASASANSLAKALTQARLMARTNAPALMYQHEANKAAQMQSDLAGINRDSRFNAMMAGNQVNAVRDDGSLAGGLMSGLASGVSSAILSRAGKTDWGKKQLFG